MNALANMRVVVFWSYFTQYGQTAVAFLSTIVLARLLSPEEIGIYSASFVLIGYAALLRDFGVSNYLVQEQDLTHAKVQSAFTLNLLLGCALGSIVYVSAGIAAFFFEEERIEQVFHALALNFFIVPLGAVTFALLRKELEFKILAKIQLAAVMATATVSIVAATLGASYLSMAYGAIAGSVITALLCNVYRDSSIPIAFHLREFSSIWSYSSHSVSIGLIRHTSSSSAEIFTGKFLGMAEVAFLSKAIRLPQMASQLITNGLTSVAMPSMSKLASNRQLLKQHYSDMIEMTLGVAWPALAFIYVNGSSLISFLFGEAWMEVSELLTVACVSIGLGLVAVYAEDMLKASGNIRYISRAEPFLVTLVVIITAWAATYSLHAVLWSLVIAAVARSLTRMLLLRAALGITFFDQARSLVQSLYVLAPFTAIQLASNHALSPYPPLSTLIACGAVGAISWVALCAVTAHPVYLRVIKPSRLWRAIQSWQP